MMNKTIRDLAGLSLGLLVVGGAFAAGADLGNTQKQATNWVAIAMFAIFVAITLGITKWAAARTKSAADFYTAGGGITGFQNGLAIAGDYMSAASFLGISGLVFANGFDGLIFSIGWLVGWPVITFLMAERLRNLGKFTFADVAAYRFSQTPMRSFAATGSLVVVAFYMIAQMVGAGQLIKVLFGLDYIVAVIIVGVLMMCYVLFGGMTATTWVQIIKAIMLLTGATFMALAVLYQFGFNPEALFAKAVEVHSKHDAIMAPGALIKDPISAISVGMALMFGTAGLPHILMRFFTVPSAKEARKSVGWATTWIGYFYILTFIIGFGAIVMLTQAPDLYYVDSDLAKGLKGGGNMAAIHLANAVGGNVFLGFISAVAFATILAVVSGLTLSGASAVSHDLYATVFKHGNADSASELRVSKMTTVCLGIVAVLLGIAFEKENVAYMVMLAFAIAWSRGRSRPATGGLAPRSPAPSPRPGCPPADALCAAPRLARLCRAVGSHGAAKCGGAVDATRSSPGQQGHLGAPGRPACPAPSGQLRTALRHDRRGHYPAVPGLYPGAHHRQSVYAV